MELRFVFFIAVMSALVVSAHVYLYRRLIRDTATSRYLRTAGKVVVAVLAVLLVGGRFLHRLWPNPVTQAVGDFAYVWMGMALFLLLAVATLGAARWTVRRARRTSAKMALVPAAGPSSQSQSQPQSQQPPPPMSSDQLDGASAPPVDESRRLFLSRAVAGGAVTVAGATSGYGIWRAYHEPVVTELAVRLPGLPKALDGMSIVHLTDIHVGNLIERRFMDELVRRANALKPDLVAVTGDLVDGDVEQLGPAVAALSNLRTRYGTFFCCGNHEYYSGDLAWAGFLESIGVQVLRNRHVRVGDAAPGGASFDLAGVDDWSFRGRARGYDLDRALAGRDADRGLVLLAHQPANFEGAVEKGVGLQLSGHTHGGQLFPMTLLVGLQWEHVAGHYTHKDGHIYVGRGCGFWGPPMRVGSPPEIVKVVLTA